MLTSDLIKPRLRLRGSSLSVEMLPINASTRRTAADLIDLLRAHVGQSQAAWKAAVDAYLGERLDYHIVGGLTKVLSDAATFQPRPSIIDSQDLRARLFSAGPVFAQSSLFFPKTRADAMEALAQELAASVDELEAALYADHPDEYVLTEVGVDWTPDDLIARYNLELARGVLYWASEMRIDIHDHYKDFWRYVKLFKLMFEAKPNPDGGYHVQLDGPISPFVKATTRYGRQFAAFLPALFLGERWQMVADVRSPLGYGTSKAQYQLDHTTPLRTHFKGSGVFDSLLEADFAAEFAAKFGDERGQWLLAREDEALLLGDTLMIPDFSLTHKRDGRRALIEIVGFWHPNYLRRKVEKARAASRRNLILLVYEGVNLTEEKLTDVPGEVLYFKNKPVLKDVMAAVERVAE